MVRSFFVLGFSLVVFFIVPQIQQTHQKAYGQEPSRLPPIYEQLQFPTLAGWREISNFNDSVGENSEWIPKDQTLENWQRKITIQAFRGSPLTVNNFLALAVERSVDVCDEVSASPIQVLKTEKKDVGERVVYCHLYKGDNMGHSTLYWVLRGYQALYVTSLTWRTASFEGRASPISQEDIEDAQRLTRQISLCTKNHKTGNCN